MEWTPISDSLETSDFHGETGLWWGANKPSKNSAQIVKGRAHSLEWLVMKHSEEGPILLPCSSNGISTYRLIWHESQL